MHGNGITISNKFHGDNKCLIQSKSPTKFQVFNSHTCQRGSIISDERFIPSFVRDQWYEYIISASTFYNQILNGGFDYSL